MILDYKYDELKACILTNSLAELDLPIDPVKLIRHLYNVELFFEELYGEEGYTFYIPAKDKYRIYVDVNCSVGRRNFTIAHEVGHVVLGHFLYFDVEDPEIHKMLDKHANVFASALLMPTHILKRFDSFNEHYIAEAFNVSLEALRVRQNYVNINIIR